MLHFHPNLLFPHVNTPSSVWQCCAGSGFLESDPAELWNFLGSGAGLDVIFAQAGSGSGLSKTCFTLFNFFAFCFFPSKILLITWEFWTSDAGWCVLCCSLTYHAWLTFTPQSWGDVSRTYFSRRLLWQIACIVRHVSKVGVLFAPSKKPTFQKLSNVSMCIQLVAGWDWVSQH